MLCLCTLACLVSATLASLNISDLDQQWLNYKWRYRKSYGWVAEILRRQTWEKNLKYVTEHNQRADKGETTFWLEMNKYADMTNEEFVRTMNGFKIASAPIKRACTPLAQPFSNTTLPDELDWRTKGYVTPVKNQLHCGSCWAFSATGSLEGQHFKKTGVLVNLSESNLIDCSWPYGNEGCLGGDMGRAFTYIIQNGGIDTQDSYPYGRPEVFSNKTCKFQKANIGATETSCIDLPKGNETHLHLAVGNIGPISVAMDASNPSFQMYKHGVYKEEKCRPHNLDHGVLVVGYGTMKHIFEKPEEYWLVKNSWGEDWGQKGYFWIARNANNMCGIATQATYPTV